MTTTRTAYAVTIPDNDFISIDSFVSIANRLDTWYEKIYLHNETLYSFNKKEFTKFLNAAKQQLIEWTIELKWDVEPVHQWWAENIKITSELP